METECEGNEGQRIGLDRDSLPAPASGPCAHLIEVVRLNFVAPISISSYCYLEKCSYFERKLWRTEMSAGELFDKALWIIGR